MKKLFHFIACGLKWSCIITGAGCLALMAMLLLLLFAAIVGGGKKPRVENKSVLVLDLANGIADKPADENAAGVLADLLGDGNHTVSLRAVTDSLRLGARDPRIAALYLHGSIAPMGYESGFAALKEVREAILEFRHSGKPVVAYLVNAGKRDIYLTSAADEILMNPIGTVEFNGLAATGTFFKNAGDKYGIEFQPVRHGKYKGAVEPFLRSDFSPENKEQLGALFADVWAEVINSVADTRQIKPDALQALADSHAILRADTAKTAGLITGTAYEAKVLERLRTITGKTGKYDRLAQISPEDYAPEARRSQAKGILKRDTVAVIYAEGEIADGYGKGGGEGIYGDRFAKMLREVQKDNNVKAVVLRVNSPGGSVTASEVILEEMRNLHKSRPLVVSMGTVAASGGYFISTASDRIFAEPDTITGSIGVFGLHLNLQKLANDHGITFDTVKTGRFADSASISRPWSDEEMMQMQNLVDSFYADFLARVSSGRNLTTNRVDELGQGRVWSGAAARKIALVDELGGLDAAIADAAQRAKLTQYTIAEYPHRKDFMELLKENLDKRSAPLAREGLAGRVAAQVSDQLDFLTQFNSACGVYARLPFDLDVR
ncbi:MAG: signal peptide peptidase SppA [Verrucomicrobiota bacterium]